jgi:hypothetical protein
MLAPSDHRPSSPPRLAAAFLALSDADPAPDARFAPPAVLAALAASVLLALSGPLAWVSRPVLRPTDQPAAVASKAAALPGPDDDGEG